jgi:hypothetical protein
VQVFELALLLGIPVYKLINEMPYEEFIGWMAYFEARPYEWRADDRASKLIQAWGAKEKPWKIFPSLEPIYHPKKEINEDGMDMSSLKGSFLFQKMMEAQGGDMVEL